MNETNLPVPATTPDPDAPELSDPMDPRNMPWYPDLMPALLRHQRTGSA